LRAAFAEFDGVTTRAAAAELDQRGIATPTGGQWSAMAVLRIRKRLAGVWSDIRRVIVLSPEPPNHPPRNS
jgi:hypothetical protein